MKTTSSLRETSMRVINVNEIWQKIAQFYTISMKTTSSLRETSMRVINVNQIWQKEHPERQRNRVARGIWMRTSSTFFFYIQMDRKEPTTQKIIL